MSLRSDRRRARDHHPSSFPRPRGAFAHPSEEVFAGLLTLYGIEWVYEPVEFPLAWAHGGAPSRAFRPDFYLPGRRLFIELTTLHQRLVTKKNQKVRALRELYPEVQIEVVYRAQFGEIAARHQLGSLLDEWAA